MPEIILYGTSACHLCEVAEAMLQTARDAGYPFTYRAVDISDSDELFERYGLIIPVLRDAGGRELGWPFEPSALADFLEQVVD